MNRLRPAADTALGFAELLALRGGDGPADRRLQDIGTLIEHCRTVSSLLRELSDLLRIGNGALQLHEQQIEAADLAEIAMNRCAAAAARYDVTLTVHLAEGIEIKGDPARLRQALEALVIHAMAAATGNTLRFALERSGSGGLAFSLLSRTPPPEPGECDYLLRAPFDQLGLGSLGPAVARRIALRHGGDVIIAPGPGGGTSYRLTLPAPRVTWPRAEGRTGLFAA